MQDITAPAAPDDRYTGVRSLWIKVIIRAVFDWVNYRDAHRLQQLKLAESAARWLFEPSELYNGFENICFLLDLDVAQVRRAARRMTKEQVARFEGVEASVLPLFARRVARRQLGEPGREMVA